MSLPTTRRARFIFYRLRALKRRRLNYNRTPTLSGVASPLGDAPTRRQRDTAGSVLQNPRDYPLHQIVTDNDLADFNVWATPPRRGQWGVPQWAGYTEPGWGWNTHAERAKLGYVKRRVHWIPRLGQLPFKPWRHPIDAIPLNRFYPFPFYPSGKPSHRSTLGP